MLPRFSQKYLKLIISKALDKSHMVRKKVIQILTIILDFEKFKESTYVLRVLLAKW